MVLHWVSKVLNLGLGILKTVTAVNEVIPSTIWVAALACVGFFWKVFLESAGVIRGEGMPGGKPQGCGG